MKNLTNLLLITLLFSFGACKKPERPLSFKAEIADAATVSLTAGDLSAKGSYCCAFENGTKCYSSDCSFCGCNGDAKKVTGSDFTISVNVEDQASLSLENAESSGSYCCTFDDGTKCYSSDCSACGCSGK